MMQPAPIALFVYNRPGHTRQTVESLQKNELAAGSELFVFCDGPKSEADCANVQTVRDYIKNINGFKSITVIERDSNLGLAASVIAGVTEVINQHGRIIVVEDDLISAPYFLTYMNDAFETYENEEKVMHIAGYMYPIDPSGLKQTFFYRASSCWGWGTWKRAWTHFEPDIERLIAGFNDDLRDEFCIDGTYDFWGQMQAQRDNRINSWAIRWYASVFLRNGLCLHPSKSLINNIGFDGTGVHCAENDFFRAEIARKKVCEFEKKIEENGEALTRIKKFLIKTRQSFLSRVFRKSLRMLSKYDYKIFEFFKGNRCG